MAKTRLTRRDLLRAAGTVAGATALAPLLKSEARADGGYDPAQRFLRLVPGGCGVIYGVQSTGELMWYLHRDWLTGRGDWANAGTGRQIGTDWQQFKTVLANTDGQIFAFRGDGTLLWYRYVVSDWTTGAGSWAAGSGSVIGSGFDVYPKIFGGWGGVIYGVDANGDLYWYKYTAGTGAGGAAAWVNGGLRSCIGWGWKSFIKLWAAPNGVIFGARQGRTLHWWRYLGTSGEVAWAYGGNALQIAGYEWPDAHQWSDDRQKEWLADWSGVLYVVPLDTGAVIGNDDELRWYRLTNSETVDRDGGPRWSDFEGRRVGWGFSVERTAALQGYGSSLSVSAGDSIGFAVSTTFSSYRASIVRLARAGGTATTVLGPMSYTGRLQTLSSDFRTNGCGWSMDVTVHVPSSWPSGVYAAKLEVPAYGAKHYVPFVVKPFAPSSAIAFLLPTNTYRAYDTWGGHNHYTPGGTSPTVLSSQRPSSWSAEVAPTGTISHMLGSDLILLRWLTEQSIAIDCYQDADLHFDDWLPSYKALVVGSHPEYWSDDMRRKVVAFTSNGGRLIYTGGNGLYERVSFPDRTKISFCNVPGAPAGCRDLFGPAQPESQVIGVNMGGAYMTFFPYQVVHDHPFLTRTSLVPRSTFGGASYNDPGGASGWEVDQTPGGISGLTVIAQGQNPGGGADMVFIDKGHGGWVFSAGSISFNGGLFYDAHMSQLLRNVFDAAVA